jgi:hypothetical protein
MKPTKTTFFRLLIIVLGVLVFFTNYQPGKYLLGWDNFNSELNPTLAIQQAAAAGWSQFRSFGLVAGMGYATDLIHALFVWLAQAVLPQDSIRYVFHTMLLTVGAVGAYELFLLFELAPPLALIGGLSFMFNFGTIQIFGLPYEPFSTFFGMLPWALIVWIKNLSQTTKKRFFAFALVNLLLTGAFYVQTMFVVYMMILGIVTTIYIIFIGTQKRTLLISAIQLLLSIALINSYWILSQLYFLKDAVSTVRDAKQTLLGWHVPYFQNIAHSTIGDFFQSRGFYLDFNGRNGLVFVDWIKYLSNPIVRVGEMIMSLFIMLGIVDGKNRYKKIMLGLLILDAVALLSNLPVFKEVNGLLRSVSVVDQVFRAPFSKFIALHALTLAYFLALGIEALSLKNTVRRIGLILSGIALTSILVTAMPVFGGRLFANDVKVTIPRQYRQLFTFFNTQDRSKRIALLPETQTWGWYTYSWGYTGSGFLWHGIAQPIISRSYDVWSKASENYFWELSDALHKNDTDELKRVLQKYAVSYLLVDDSLATGQAETMQLEEIKQLLENMNVSEVFHAGNIRVYEMGTTPGMVVSTPTITNIGPVAHSLTVDSAFSSGGTYSTDNTRPFDSYFPFLDMQTATNDSQKHWSLGQTNQTISLSAPVPDSVESYELVQPETTVKVEQLVDGAVQEVVLPVTLTVNNHILTATFPKLSVGIDNISNVAACTPASVEHKIPVDSSIAKDGKLTVVTKEGANACWGFHYDKASLSQGYLIELSNKNLSGLAPSAYVVDHTRRQKLLETQLNEKSGTNFILPDGASDGIGFSVDFQSFSFSHTISANVLDPVAVYIFPTRLLSQIHFQKTESSPQAILKNLALTSNHPYLYKTQVSAGSTVVLNQAYDAGWLAFDISSCDNTWLCNNLPFLPKKPLSEHRLINNWANGWTLGSSQPTVNSSQQEKETSVNREPLTIIFFYWPQLLEFAGFILLPLPFLRAVVRKS